MADGTQFPPRPDFYRAARATRLETALRATPSNPTAHGCPVGFGRRCWARTTESCLSRATTARGPIFTAGPAGLVAGAVSMALRRICAGVESARQRQVAARPGRRALREMPAAELDELAAIYQAKGVSPQTAAQVAAELTAHDALAAHVDVELRLDPDDLANPLQAAAASAASFTVGSLLPCPLFGCHQRRFGFPSPSSPC